MSDIDEPVPVLSSELSREEMGKADAWDLSELRLSFRRTEDGRVISRYKVGSDSFIEFTELGGGELVATDMSGVEFVRFEGRLRFRRDPSASASTGS
jgi:hypothetical protein